MSNLSKKTMQSAFRAFTINPSATNWIALEKAMLTYQHDVAGERTARVFARLDAAGTAKPKMELVTHVREGDCISPASAGLDSVQIRETK
jgi:hypothetical protein